MPVPSETKNTVRAAVGRGGRGSCIIGVFAQFCESSIPAAGCKMVGNGSIVLHDDKNNKKRCLRLAGRFLSSKGCHYDQLVQRSTSKEAKRRSAVRRFV